MPHVRCVYRCVSGRKSQGSCTAVTKPTLQSGERVTLVVFTWRAVEIEPEELYEYIRKAHSRMVIAGGFMRASCKKLFHD